MSDAVWAAAIAVGGTLLGAAIAPAAGLARDSKTARADDSSRRVRAVAEFAASLDAFARTNPARVDGVTLRGARSKAIAQRFELATTLRKGAGAVDRFAAVALDVIDEHADVGARLVVAAHAASMLLAWARGDLRATELAPFELVRNGPEWEVV